ncbi:MAG: TetR/AcrR family transcriptional regulator [Verrucomicrobia bacterium]|nr:TetR/AcrR family transcriptional regulator [Verrucomicrobiota bacterium]
MGSPERRERERQETRQRILQAARELFATHGYEAVTMREIAKRIEYTPTAIYFHFKDKEALLRELCRNDFRALAQYLHRIGRIPDPIERIKKMGQAYVEFGLKYPHHYRLQFMTPLLDPHLEQTGIEKGNPDEDAYAFLRLSISEALRAGRFRPELDDPDLLAQMFWAGVHGVISLFLSKEGDTWIQWCPARRLAKTILEALIRGTQR